MSLITEATRRRVARLEVELERRDAVALKGKQVPVALWAPQPMRTEARRAEPAGAQAGD